MHSRRWNSTKRRVKTSQTPTVATVSIAPVDLAADSTARLTSKSELLTRKSPLLTSRSEMFPRKSLFLIADYEVAPYFQCVVSDVAEEGSACLAAFSFYL